jgi:hypothetical protein
MGSLPFGHEVALLSFEAGTMAAQEEKHDSPVRLAYLLCRNFPVISRAQGCCVDEIPWGEWRYYSSGHGRNGIDAYNNKIVVTECSVTP